MKSPDDIRELGAILVVGAHPDDEIFIAAGIMACAVRNGQRVACLTATRGEGGVQDEGRWPAARLAEIRTRELEASLKVLGVKEHTWLDYRDGECEAAESARAVEKVAAVVRAFRPDTILTFGPDGLTGHPDHRAVSRWVDRAAGVARLLWAVVENEQYAQLQEADRAVNIFFATKNPPVIEAAGLAVDLRLPADVTALKRRAFEAVPSQMERMLPLGPFDHPGEGLARECFVEAGLSTHPSG